MPRKSQDTHERNDILQPVSHLVPGASLRGPVIPDASRNNPLLAAVCLAGGLEGDLGVPP